MATIQDVAKRAGVSVATVSRVVNGSGAVSPERAAQVRAAIEALDYRPNTSGRNLRRGETRTLLVVCSVALDPALNGIHDAAEALGYRVIINYTGRKRSRATSYFSEMFYGNVDGVLLYSTFDDDAELMGLMRAFPVVQCSSYLDFPNAFRVSIDEEKAGYDMTMHLAAQGYRRIGLLALEPRGSGETFSLKRERGYRRALAEAGMPFRAELVVHCESGYETGLEAGAKFAGMAGQVDAVFCVQDILAMGVLQAIRDAGLSVPGDIAVAGFDDLEVATLCRPRLTTVSQPFYEMGSVAARMLVSLVKGEVTTGRDLYLRHEIVVRESTVRQSM